MVANTITTLHYARSLESRVVWWLLWSYKQAWFGFELIILSMIKWSVFYADILLWVNDTRGSYNSSHRKHSKHVILVFLENFRIYRSQEAEVGKLPQKNLSYIPCYLDRWITDTTAQCTVMTLRNDARFSTYGYSNFITAHSKCSKLSAHLRAAHKIEEPCSVQRWEGRRPVMGWGGSADILRRGRGGLSKIDLHTFIIRRAVNIENLLIFLLLDFRWDQLLLGYRLSPRHSSWCIHHCDR